MRSRLFNKILNGHPHSIIGKTLLLAVVFCLVLSGTRSFSANADSVGYSFGMLDSFDSSGVPSYTYYSSSDPIIDGLHYAFEYAWSNFIITYPNASLNSNYSYVYYYQLLSSILSDYDFTDPSFYVNIGIFSTDTTNFSGCIPVFIFSKHKDNNTEVVFGSDGQSYIFDYDPFIIGYAYNYYSYYGSAFNSYVSVPGSSSYTSSGSQVVSIDSYFESYLNDDDQEYFIVRFGGVSSSNVPYFYYNENSSFLNYIFVCSSTIYTLDLPIAFYAGTDSTTGGSVYSIRAYQSGYDYANVQYINWVSEFEYSGRSNPTPTPIPTFEAYSTPTAFPTIAINNSLTPIPEDIDPGIIWEDISTDDVAGNLHGVITTVTDFISSSVPRFYSEVLTIMYRRSDWFSFLAIIPGLSLIIFLIGRLRRK